MERLHNSCFIPSLQGEPAVPSSFAPEEFRGLIVCLIDGIWDAEYFRQRDYSLTDGQGLGEGRQRISWFSPSS
jgi:hypothetical protein